jgi:hypothetical protein
MKRKLVLLIVLFLLGCAPTFKNNTGTPIQAIYLVQGSGQLSQKDLEAHPEIRVINSLDEFKKAARSKTALWIDINAVESFDIEWLSQEPQKFYPVVLVGSGDDFCSFFVILKYFPFEVPPPPGDGKVDCSSLPSGFSINILTSDSGGKMHGYEQPPIVPAILDNTESLLESTN